MQKMRYNGHEFDMDDDFRSNLTEIWRAAGKPKNKKPAAYRRLKRNRLGMSLGNLDKWEIKGKGNNRSTWVNILVARDYAGWVGLPEKIKPKPEPQESTQSESTDRHGEDWEYTGEGWKDGYDPDMAGEEWKGEPEPRPEPYFAPGTIFVEGREGKGPDDLFFDYLVIDGLLNLRGCVN